LNAVLEDDGVYSSLRLSAMTVLIATEATVISEEIEGDEAGVVAFV